MAVDYPFINPVSPNGLPLMPPPYQPVSPPVQIVQQIAPPLYGIWFAGNAEFGEHWLTSGDVLFATTSKDHALAVINYRTVPPRDLWTIEEFGPDGKPKV